MENTLSFCSGDTESSMAVTAAFGSVFYCVCVCVFDPFCMQPGSAITGTKWASNQQSSQHGTMLRGLLVNNNDTTLSHCVCVSMRLCVNPTRTLAQFNMTTCHLLFKNKQRSCCSSFHKSASLTWCRG